MLRQYEGSHMTSLALATLTAAILEDKQLLRYFYRVVGSSRAARSIWHKVKENG